MSSAVSLVEVTNFFLGGQEKRREIESQPAATHIPCACGCACLCPPETKANGNVKTRNNITRSGVYAVENAFPKCAVGCNPTCSYFCTNKFSNVAVYNLTAFWTFFASFNTALAGNYGK